MKQGHDLHLTMYLSLRSSLIDYAGRMLGSRDAAEDVVQEAFIRYAPSLPGAGIRSKAYLFRIVHNLAVDVLRRRKFEDEQKSKGDLDWVAPQPEQTPEEAVLLCEAIARAIDMLSNLPKNQRVALEMVRFGGYTPEQVATHLGVSVRTAYRLVEEAMISVSTFVRQDAGEPVLQGRNRRDRKRP